VNMELFRLHGVVRGGNSLSILADETFDYGYVGVNVWPEEKFVDRPGLCCWAEGEPLSIYEVREDSLFLHGALVRVVQVEEDDVNKFKSYLCGHWKRTL